MSNLNQSSSQFKTIAPFPCHYSTSVFLRSSLSILKGHNEFYTEHSLLQTEQQPFHIAEVFHSSDLFCDPPPDPL